MYVVSAKKIHPSEGHSSSIDTHPSTAPNSILVVDSDPAARRAVAAYFEDHDIPVHTVASRKEAVRYAETSDPALIVLDVNLGKDDGLDVLRDIRSHSDVPVIITALEDGDHVIGLDLGADAYIGKPYNLRELLARVRAILRREAVGRKTRPLHVERGGYRFNGWQLERRRRRLTDPDGNAVPLSKSEYSLLVAFLEAPRRTLTREQLLAATHVYSDIADRSIDVQVMRLRRKLEIEANAPQVIRTQRGVGYVFTVDVAPF